MFDVFSPVLSEWCILIVIIAAARGRARASFLISRDWQLPNQVSRRAGGSRFGSALLYSERKLRLRGIMLWLTGLWTFWKVSGAAKTEGFFLLQTAAEIEGRSGFISYRSRGGFKMKCLCFDTVCGFLFKETHRRGVESVHELYDPLGGTSFCPAGGWRRGCEPELLWRSAACLAAGGARETQ